MKDTDVMTQLYEEKMQKIASLESDLARMKDIVVLILPLAKGYVANHNVGSNAEYIKTAEQALRLGE